MNGILQNPLIVDGTIVLIFLVCAVSMGSKGLQKLLMPTVVIVASVLLGTALSAALTEPVTELVYPIVEDSVVKRLEEGVVTEDALGALGRSLDPAELEKIVETALPSGTLKLAKRVGVDLSEFVADAAKKVQKSVDPADYLTEKQLEKMKDAGVGLKETVSSAAEKTAERAKGAVYTSVFAVTRRLTSVAVHYALWILVTVLALVLLTAAKNTFAIVLKLPLIGWADRLGGAAVGIALCSAVLYALGWLLRRNGITVLEEAAEGTKLLALFL